MNSRARAVLSALTIASVVSFRGRFGHNKATLKKLVARRVKNKMAKISRRRNRK